jgi:uncharacterized membrane protein
MNEALNKVSLQTLGRAYDSLTEQEQNVIRKITERMYVSHNTNQEFDSQLTFGQRLADQVAAFGGSLPFIILFFILLLIWVLTNTVLLTSAKAFDPYPFILLNLVLSMLASIQAPVIMMSQNRHAAKDRLDATHDYEVNLKAELEIIELHHKLDALRENQWQELILIQQEQIEYLKKIVEK